MLCSLAVASAGLGNVYCGVGPGILAGLNQLCCVVGPAILQD